jgi:hypothetical protein
MQPFRPVLKHPLLLHSSCRLLLLLLLDVVGVGVVGFGHTSKSISIRRGKISIDNAALALQGGGGIMSPS